MLKNNGEFTKIYRVQGNRNILIDNKNNVYFINYNNIYLLLKNKIKSLTPTVRKIDTLEGINIWNSFIDKITNKIYFATSEGPYIFKKIDKHNMKKIIINFRSNQFNNKYKKFDFL